MNNDCLRVLRHIMDAEIDNAHSEEAYTALCYIRDCVEFALAGNFIELLLMDDKLTIKEMED